MSDTLTDWFLHYCRDPLNAVADLVPSRGWAPLWTVALALAAVAAGVIAVRPALGRWRHARLAAGARTIAIGNPPVVDKAGAQQFWGSIAALAHPWHKRMLYGNPHIVWEYVFSQAGAVIQIWVPGIITPGLVERFIEAAWPGARTSTRPAARVLPAVKTGPLPAFTVSRMSLALSESLPLKTDFDADPLRMLFGASTSPGPGDVACVHILARPASPRRVARAHARARSLRIRSGGGAGALAGSALRAVADLLLDLLTPTTLAPPAGPARTTLPGTDAHTRLEHTALHTGAAAKLRGTSVFEMGIRYAAAVHPTSAVPEAVAQAAAVARGRAGALAASMAVFSGLNSLARHRIRRDAAATLESRRLGRGDVVSLAEIAALAHLPTDPATPGVHRAGARPVPPPPGIPIPGSGSKRLGLTDTGHPRPVALRVTDARQHTHVTGPTGTGKSTLLATLIDEDIMAGRGVVAIDNKGDLISDILSRLPKTVKDRVVLFDPSATTTPCLNPLDGADSNLVVDNLVGVTKSIFRSSWGDRTEDVMRSACLTLRTQPGPATLADLAPLLTDPAVRARKTAYVTNPVLQGFWREYESLSDGARMQRIGPLAHKLRSLLLRPFVFNALAAGPSTVSMRDVLDEGGICLVRIPKGQLGNDGSRLIGSLIVAHTWHAATARADTAQSQRPDSAIVIDECQNFLAMPIDIADMLAEARAYHLSITLAHQHLGQLTPELREGIGANARNKIHFASPPDDAKVLARHTAPRVTEHDLAHLAKYHAAVRLMVNGEATEPFTLATEPLPPAIAGRAVYFRGTSGSSSAAGAVSLTKTPAKDDGLALPDGFLSVESGPPPQPEPPMSPPPAVNATPPAGDPRRA